MKQKLAVLVLQSRTAGLGLNLSSWHSSVKIIKAMNPKVSLVINQLKPYKPEKIILFGSYAQGTNSAESDVDLVLIKKTTQPYDKRLKKVRMLLSTTTPVDVFVFTPKEFKDGAKKNLFLAEISKTGKVIYE